MATYRIWPSASGPSNADNGDPVTLGTRFRLSATGWVTHLHYWRGTTDDNGTHQGVVYLVSGGTQVSGTLVTFVDSGTGWQTAALAAPVQLAADTLYCVAVFHPNGRPAFTGAYWVSGGPGASGITNGILTAPNSADAGGQGVFNGAGSLAHPTGSFNQTNYWVDLTVTDTDPTQQTASATDPIGLTDTSAAALDFARTAADTTGITDTAQTLVDFGQTPADPIGLTDTATALLEAGQSAADPVGLTDTAAADLAYGTDAADAAGITDTFVALLDTVRTVEDFTGIADAATAALDAARTPVDPVGITDAATAVLTVPGQHDPDWDFRFGPPYTDSYALGPPHD